VWTNTLRRSADSIVKQALQWTHARLQRKRSTQEHLETGFAEGNVDGRLQVQLEEDGGGC